VVVTSYEIVIADVKHLQRYAWKYIVVDEGHRLKNFNCKLLRELRTIHTGNKLLLSGALPNYPALQISTPDSCMRLPCSVRVQCMPLCAGTSDLEAMCSAASGHLGYL
jgi:hypothetical protein